MEKGKVVSCKRIVMILLPPFLLRSLIRRDIIVRVNNQICIVTEEEVTVSCFLLSLLADNG